MFCQYSSIFSFQATSILGIITSQTSAKKCSPSKFKRSPLRISKNLNEIIKSLPISHSYVHNVHIISHHFFFFLCSFYLPITCIHFLLIIQIIFSSKDGLCERCLNSNSLTCIRNVKFRQNQRFSYQNFINIQNSSFDQQNSLFDISCFRIYSRSINNIIRCTMQSTFLEPHPRFKLIPEYHSEKHFVYERPRIHLF